MLPIATGAKVGMPPPVKWATNGVLGSEGMDQGMDRPEDWPCWPQSVLDNHPLSWHGDKVSCDTCLDGDRGQVSFGRNRAVESGMI